MKRTLLLFVVHASACLSALAQSPGDILYQTKNAGAGSTVRSFTPSTSTDLLSLNGSGLITRTAQSTFALASHTQAISTITGLQTALDGLQPLATPLTNFAELANSAGVLTNNGSGTLSYTATSTGGNTFGLDAGKIAVYDNLGEFTVASALRLTAGPSLMGVWFGGDRLAKASTTSVRTWTLPNVSGTLITTGDTGTVTNAMLAGSIALSKLTITGTPNGTQFLRDDGSWQTVTSGATLGANTFTALQQFSGTDHAGLRLNNLTTTQRDALTGSAGMVIWNTTDGRMQLHNGTSWTSGMVRLAGDTMTGALTLPAGTVSAPALNLGDSGTGIYRSATNEFAITNNGTQRLRTTTSGVTVTGTLTIGSGGITDLGGGQLSITSAGHYAFSSGFSATGLLRVSTSGNAGGNYAQWSALAAHTAIQRDSTNAQAAYVANTYASTTSYEAIGFSWSSNVGVLSTVKGSGGGTARNLRISTDTTIHATFETDGDVILNYDELPTSDPVVKGQLWRSGTALQISAGP
jgi:hypothetical protein